MDDVRALIYAVGSEKAAVTLRMIGWQVEVSGDSPDQRDSPRPRRERLRAFKGI